VIAIPALPAEPPTLARPAIVAPGTREVSFGTVSGRVDSRTARIIVKVDDEVVAELEPSPETSSGGFPHRIPFRVQVDLPPRNVTLRVVAIDGAGNRTASSVAPVYGLPAAARPRTILSDEDAVLAERIRELAQGYPGVAAVFVQDLTTGRGAAWNARARYMGASTLKLGIALEVLRVLGAKPRPGTRVEHLFANMLVLSSNRAANELEVWLGGSTTAGSARVTTTLHYLGLTDSAIYGGYVLGTSTQRPIPVRVESQPPYYITGKYSTAWDLARLHRMLHRAAGGGGPLLQLPGHFTASDARYMLYTLAHVRDTGKLDRYIGERPGVSVLHKAGWISQARHDTGLVFWREGAIVAAVMTWSSSGAGTSSDVLAGRVAEAALDRFSALPAPRLDPHSWRLQS
jgi:Beta-lactamase enzyme family